MQEQRQRKTTGGKGPRTLHGVYREMQRQPGATVPSLKALARSIVSQGQEVWNVEIVADTRRWLQAKRPGGTDAERAARQERRRERRSIQAAAPKGGSKLKSGGGEKGSKRGGR